MSRIAIIGAGIAGVGVARFLHRAGHDLTLFEQNDRLGGHTNTVEAEEPPAAPGEPTRRVPIDTGFMVFNRDTYPLLSRLFDEFQVPVKKAALSFSVRDDASGIEWRDGSLNHLFARRRNLLSPRLWRMAATIKRFNQDAHAALDDPAVARETLGDYVRRHGYGRDFIDLYLTPLGSPAWNTRPELMADFPAAGLLRFFHHHGLLGPRSRRQWWTVDGGSREYLARLIAPFRDRILKACPATRIVRHGPGRGVTVLSRDGATHAFDQVVVATHADQALRLVVNPTRDELAVLGAFKYQPVTATLHTDAGVMPREPRAWAACNHQLARDDLGRLAPATHYHMNALQDLGAREHYFVSINRPEAIDPAKVVKTIAYEHPVFDFAATESQRRLPALNAAARGSTETYFAGGYFRHGLHEDAFMSAVQLAELLLERDPWTT